MPLDRRSLRPPVGADIDIPRSALEAPAPDRRDGPVGAIERYRHLDRHDHAIAARPAPEHQIRVVPLQVGQGGGVTWHLATASRAAWRSLPKEWCTGVWTGPPAGK